MVWRCAVPIELFYIIVEVSYMSCLCSEVKKSNFIGNTVTPSFFFPNTLIRPLILLKQKQVKPTVKKKLLSLFQK